MDSNNRNDVSFKKDDSISKSDAVYPHGALIVDGYDNQDRLLAQSKGRRLSVLCG